MAATWNSGLVYEPWLGIGASNMVGQPSPFGLANELLSQRPLWSFFANGAEWLTWLTLQQRNNSFGPSMGFCRTMTALGKRTCFGKYSQSASSLVDDWRPSGPPGLWAACKTWWATQRLRFPGTLSGGGLVIANGYADGLTPELAAEYEPQMLVLIDDWRSIYGSDQRIVISRLNIDVTGCPEKATIWAAQNNIAVVRPNVLVLDTDGLPTSDGVHWTQGAQVTVGDGLGALAGS